MQVLNWLERSEAALEPAGLVAVGQVARQLLLRLQEMQDHELHQLSIVTTRNLLVLIGSGDKLPWLEGARYCAPDPIARELWLPTHIAPNLPSDLLQANLATRLKRMPALLWNEPEHILPLDKPITLTSTLLTWLIKEFD